MEFLNRQRWATRIGTLGLIALLVSCGSGDESSDNAQDTSAPIQPTLQATEDVLIQCASDCSEAIASIKAVRGVVKQRFANVEGLSATIPVGSFLALSRMPGITDADKDSIQPSPKPTLEQKIIPQNVVRQYSLSDENGRSLSRQNPKSFAYDSILTGAIDLHAEGNFGDDIVVAIIDSGTANNSDTVPALADSVIGGESFIEDPAEPSATSTLNDDHGTWVGTMVAGHGAFVMDADSSLLQAVSKYEPESVITLDDGTTIIPMIGTAPGAKLYALKIFAADQDGAPRSRTLAALDRVLTLKRNFDRGRSTDPVAGDGSEENPFVYDALNIQVVNVSLGGPTLYAGRSLEDILIDRMLREGIVVVAAAGNEGFAAMTGASPGAAVAAVTVGAANVPSHERILRELQIGPDGGLAYRPTDHIQIAEFSSRGPTADGRPDPDLVANGFAVFVQGADGGVGLVSGTSFSSPTVAGAAALLFADSPQASATQVRSALIESANDGLVGGMPSVFDQGNGFLDIPAAQALLNNSDDDTRAPRLPPANEKPQSVANNIERLGIETLTLADDDEDEHSYNTTVELAPGQVKQFFINSPRDADSLVVELTNITPELPPNEQNEIFGDDVAITVVDAPISYNETRVHEFLVDDSTFTVSPLQTGLVRVALMGDWTNAGNVTADLGLRLGTKRLPRPSFSGELSDTETDEKRLRLGPNIGAVTFELAWQGTWAVNPAHDLDLIVIDPQGEVYLEGATLASPERLTIDNPQPGDWTVLVDGFTLHGFEDDYVLRITDQDDQILIREDDD